MRWFAGLFLATATFAVPVSIAPGDFGSGVISLDFIGMVPGAPVNGFYAGQGIDFGPGLYMSDSPGVITNRLGLLPELPVQVLFAAIPRTWQVGFEIQGAVGDLLQLTVLDEFGSDLGTVDYFLGGSFEFVGLAEPRGMATLQIQNVSFGEGQIYIRNFQYEQVPEPASLWLMAGGLAVWAYEKRKRS